MNKKLNFSKNLVLLILNGEKRSTWRLWDDKDLKAEDIVDFFEFGSSTSFVKAKLTKVIEKPMGTLKARDRSGHEIYKDDSEMYQTYTGYYKRAVGPETIVKICWFEVLT
jgi:hypothetical protein